MKQFSRGLRTSPRYSALTLLSTLFFSLCTFSMSANGQDKKSETHHYKFDIQGAHAFVQFRIKHLGYSWLYGRFNDFDGRFSFNSADPSKNSFEATIDMTSLDSNHAERDKHLRGDEFLDVKKYPSATFKSTKYIPTGEKTANLEGQLTLFGVTKPVVISLTHVGGGKDPWGGFRQGFEGRATIKPANFGKNFVPRLGQSAAEVELLLTVEGIRQG